MLIQPDCFPCILKMALSTIRALQIKEETANKLYCQILSLAHLHGHHWDITNEEVIEMVLKMILSHVDHPDPFHALKFEQNKMIMNIYPWLQDQVTQAPDPLYTAVKLAILGNAIDMMVSDNTLEIEQSIINRLQIPISGEAFAHFNQKLSSSRFLVYFGDNSGEIVFDKLLIETIKKTYDVEIVYVVKSHPMLNDVTLREAAFVGLDKIVPVIGNGVDGPLPGTILRRCSEEVREACDHADLLISKGGANFDTLEEEYKRRNMNITFMFLSKCQAYCRYLGNPLNQPVLANYHAKP